MSKLKLIEEEYYECDFKEYYGIIDLVLPENMNYYNFEKYYNNPNITVLIIKKMCIGIVFPLYIAEKFGYIKNVLKYNNYEEIYENGMKIVYIDEKWDIKKWNYIYIINFYNSLPYIIDKSCTFLELKKIDSIKNNKNTNYDFYFLESLCWNIDLI